MTIYFKITSDIEILNTSFSDLKMIAENQLSSDSSSSGSKGTISKIISDAIEVDYGYCIVYNDIFSHDYVNEERLKNISTNKESVKRVIGKTDDDNIKAAGKKYENKVLVQNL